ncbi:hypothetical protein EC973_004154 [Apophysomyces ossiformis]|uniref:Uncharacterized protein n=1 Tax=Apophysomyces ossiformis TaxID=679940 RepID=A0A8H7BKI4_9FUNG|nr:hypothetical protein EC973_004154 [Apophysomyces ossiformis]
MENGHRQFRPDQPIHQKEELTDDFPRYAMMVLSNVSYRSARDPLHFKGYVSKHTAKKLQKKSLEGKRMNFRFSTYAFDNTNQSWFLRFLSGALYPEPNTIAGRIRSVSVMDSATNKKRKEVELTMDPIPELVQTLSYAVNSASEPLRLFWGGEEGERSPCVKSDDYSQDAFDQLVMSDVLF